ncbi:MAG: cobalamin-dependent protein, partial [Syntrophobacteraceae bacterium]
MRTTAAQASPAGGGPLRIALVFPPATHPTSPPLGIASLKAYLGAGGLADVRNFDLNLAYYEQALDWVRDGRLKVGLRKMDQGETARRAPAARDFFRGRGRTGREKFFDLAAYNAQADTYTGFAAVVNGLFDSFSRKILLDLPAPPLVERFFDDLIDPLRSFRPDLVGFSILFSQQLFFALALAKLCKKMGAKTVFGGATFSVMPDPARLRAGPVPVRAGGEARSLDLAPLMDFLIVGEGEAGLKALADALRGGGLQPRGGAGVQPHLGTGLQPHLEIGLQPHDGRNFQPNGGSGLQPR